MQLLDFFHQMAQAFLDSYLCVLLAIDQICGKHILVKRKNLVRELHTAVKELYSDKVIPHLHSCLDEILSTSLSRFEQMQLVEVSSYGNEKGAMTSFVQSHYEQRDNLDKTLTFLSGLRPFTVKE